MSLNQVEAFSKTSSFIKVLDGIRNLLDADSSSFFNRESGKYERCNKSSTQINRKIKITIALPKPNIIPAIRSKFPRTDISRSFDCLGTEKVINREKKVRESTKANTNDTSIVSGQLPKKNSCKNGISTIIGIKLGPKFIDKAKDTIHATIVKHSRRIPLK